MFGTLISEMVLGEDASAFILQGYSFKTLLEEKLIFAKVCCQQAVCCLEEAFVVKMQVRIVILCARFGL